MDKDRNNYLVSRTYRVLEIGEQIRSGCTKMPVIIDESALQETKDSRRFRAKEGHSVRFDNYVEFEETETTSTFRAKKDGRHRRFHKAKVESTQIPIIHKSQYIIVFYFWY